MTFCNAKHPILIATAMILLSVFCPMWGRAQQSCDCDDCFARFAIKTNLAHDVLLTPDLGVEMSLGRRFSVSAEGVWAWWSRSSNHRYWRVYGGWAELRWWFGRKAAERALTGHHAGVYGSVHSFDFEFGGKGWQSPGLMYSAGISYGYSVALGRRLNLDMSARVGYMAGRVVEYEPQCGTYVCLSRGFKRYFGPTSLEITLVWFPGRGRSNSPDFDL